MSGGSFGYVGDYIGNNVFGYLLSVHYDNIDNPAHCRLARNMNPMDDRDVSELLYDMACLLHSCEWYKSGDICEETYREHIAKFKKKWFKRTDTDRLQACKDDLKSYYEQLAAELECDAHE